MGLWKVNNGGRDEYRKMLMGNRMRKVGWLQASGFSGSVIWQRSLCDNNSGETGLDARGGKA